MRRTDAASHQAPSPMHPLPRHALPLLLALPMVIGCGPTDRTGGPSYPVSEAQFQQDPAERDSALQLLRAMDTAPFETAFERLPRYRYTRHTRTERLTPDEEAAAAAEQTVQFDFQGGERVRQLLAADTTGTFDAGLLARLAPDDHGEDPARSPTNHLLPDDPPYLDDRNREAFLYRLLPDTLLGELRVRVVEVQARPGEGDKQAIRRARFYVAPRTGGGTLVALLLDRAHPATLFYEQSTFALQLGLHPDGAWLPHHLRFQSHVEMPLRTPQFIRTTSDFSDYATGPTTTG